MLDIILSFFAASGVPIFLAAQSFESLEEGIFGRLPYVPGGLPVGILLLLLAQVLASTLVWKAAGLYYVYWYFRDWYSSKESVLDAVGFTSTLPVSPLMRRKLRRSIILQFFIRVVWPNREERLRREGLL